MTHRLIRGLIPCLLAALGTGCGAGIFDLDSVCRPNGEFATTGCAVVTGRVLGFAHTGPTDRLIVRADLPPYNPADIDGIADWQGGPRYSINIKRRVDQVGWPDTVSAILRWTYQYHSQVTVVDSATVLLYFAPQWSEPAPVTLDIVHPQ